MGTDLFKGSHQVTYVWNPLGGKVSPPQFSFRPYIYIQLKISAQC